MVKAKGSIKYLSCAITAVVLWGFFAFPLRRIQSYSPQQILYYRVFVSFIVVWGVNLLFRRSKLRQDYQHLITLPKPIRNKLIGLIVGAGICITGNWFSFIYVINHISLKAAAFAYMVCPIITAAGGFILLKEPVTRLKIAAIFIAILSVAILSTTSIRQAMWSVIVALMYALYLIIQRVLNRFDKLNLLAIQLLVATIIVSPFYFYDAALRTVSLEFLIVILIIAVVLTIIPLWLTSYALNGIPSSTIGITIYVNPVISFLVAFVWFNEKVDAIQIAGYAMLVLAVIVFNWNIIVSSTKSKQVAA